MEVKYNFGVEVNNSNLLHSVKNPENEISVKNPLMEVKVKNLLEILDKSEMDWFHDYNEDSFKNKENFIQGVMYITELNNSQITEDCISILNLIIDKYEEMEEAITTFLSFFCEVGVWKNSNVRMKKLYHKDFSQYLKNCMVTWLGNDYKYWFAL